MKRITWLVGPPGAGKTTFTSALPVDTRIVELTDMLGPLVDPVRMRQGVLGANGMLVSLIRHLELHPGNLQLPSLVVVAGLVREEDLFPLGEHEEVWLLLPSRDLWQRQLASRPAGGGSSGQYDDHAYAAQWYDRFAGWSARGLPLRHLGVAHRPELLGKIAQTAGRRARTSPVGG